MLIVGLTGGIGSGKSEVARQFVSLGVQILRVETAVASALGQLVLLQRLATAG